jgi:hypothetical protein
LSFEREALARYVVEDANERNEEPRREWLDEGV